MCVFYEMDFCLCFCFFFCYETDFCLFLFFTNRLSQDKHSATKYVQNLVPNLIAMSSNANTDLVIMPAVEFYKREQICASLLTQNRNLLNLNTKLLSQSTKQTNGLYVFVCITNLQKQRNRCDFALFCTIFYSVIILFVYI